MKDLKSIELATSEMISILKETVEETAVFKTDDMVFFADESSRNLLGRDRVRTDALILPVDLDHVPHVNDVIFTLTEDRDAGYTYHMNGKQFTPKNLRFYSHNEICFGYYIRVEFTRFCYTMTNHKTGNVYKVERNNPYEFFVNGEFAFSIIGSYAGSTVAYKGKHYRFDGVYYNGVNLRDLDTGSIKYVSIGSFIDHTLTLAKGKCCLTDSINLQ